MKGKKANLNQSILLLLIVVVEIVALFKSGISLQIPLFVVWPTIFIFCKFTGLDYSLAEETCFDSIRKGLQTLMIMVAVGALIGTWISAGTIPSLIYFGLQLINPKVFLLCALIITSIMSVATGTAYGSAASAGIAMMGIGTAMNIPAGIVAGAVLCGATFGDKISPLSDTTNLCPALTGGTLFRHIKSMLYTTLPSYLICLIIFTVLGLNYGNTGADTTVALEVQNMLVAHFKISVISLIPVILVIALLLFHVDALPAIEISALSGVFVSWLYQNVNFVAATKLLYNGYKITTQNAIVDKLLNRGGIEGMASTFFIMLFAIGLGGMLQGLGVLDNLLSPLIKKVHTVVQLVIVTMITSYLGDMIGCAVSISHVITGNLLGPVYKKKNVAPEVCSRTMEDCGTCGGVLFPWHGNAAYYTGVLGVAFGEYFPYLYLAFITPIFSILCAVTGIGIWYNNGTGIKNDNEEIVKEEEGK